MPAKALIRPTVSRFLFGLLIGIILIAAPSFAQDSQDSQVFISGFNAYQKKEYQTAADKMAQVLKDYPDSQLRDMALFWLARAKFKAGNQKDAARYMAQFFKEYPDNPLKGTIEDELAALATAYAKDDKGTAAGEKVVAGKLPAEKAEADRLAREKAEAERLAKENAEADRLARKKAEADRLAREKAQAEKVALEKAEAEKLAREKAEAEKVANAKAEADRLAREKAEADRLERENAEADRLARKKAEADRLAREKAQAEKVAKEKAEADSLARKKSEADRLAREKAQAEKVAKEKAEAEKLIREKAEADRVARKKAEADRIAREKTEADRLAREKAEADRLERENAEADRLARKKAEANRLAREKAQADKVAKEKAEADRLADEIARADRIAREKAEQDRLERQAIESAAREKAAAERRAAEKAEAERLAKVKAEGEQRRLAAEKAAAAKLAQEKEAFERQQRDKAVQEKAEAERLAQNKAKAERVAMLNAEAEQRRLAAEKSAAEKVAREKAEADRLALRKIEAECLEREKTEAYQKRLAAEKVAAEQKRLAGEKRLAAKIVSKRKVAKPAESVRDKTVAEYKAIIDSSPGSSSADAASAKLKAMGIAYPVAGVARMAASTQPPATAQILNLEVGQFAEVDFSVATSGQAFPVGRRLMIPFEVVNRGNGNDSFYLESGFPSEYGVQFSAMDKPDVPVNLTPQLAPGQRFSGMMALAIPRGTIDGQKISYPVKLASQYARDISQSRQVTFIASAPLLRAVINTDKKEVAPGDKVTYRVALLNIGSASATGVILRLNYPPLYEPVDSIKSGFKQEMKAALILDGLKLESGQSRELTVTFQLKDEAIARQELFLRGDLINQEMETTDSFVSALALVQGISGVTARTSAEKMVVIPGQVVSIPLVVTNTGNQREDLNVQLDIPPSLTFTLYQDLNRDGIRQIAEPVINHVGPLTPREEAYVVLELKTPASETDGTSMPISVAFEPETDRKKGALVKVKLAYSRPVLELTMTGRGGRLRPGEVATYDLTCINRGSSIAKVVDMQTVLPEALELVASDPAVNRGKGGEYVWKFEELGAGEKKGARVSIRVRQGVAVGTNLQVKNLLRYQDQLGNSY